MDGCLVPLPVVGCSLYFTCVGIIVDFKIHLGNRLLELLVAVDGALRVDHHARGHEPGQDAGRYVKVHLRLLDGQLVALHVLDEVWLLHGVLQQHQKLAPHFLRSAAHSQNAASHVDLLAQNAVHKGLDGLETGFGESVRDLGYE